MRATMRHRHGSMLALFLLAGCWLALGSSRPASADEDGPSVGPALEACERFATQHYQKVSPKGFVAVRLLEEGAKAEKYQDKVGSQFVATVLSGRGVWQEKAGGPWNVRFTCLLENPEKPVFVELAKDGPRILPMCAGTALNPANGAS